MSARRVLPPPLAAPKNFAAARHVERVADIPHKPLQDSIIEIFARSEIRHNKLLNEKDNSSNTEDPESSDSSNESITKDRPPETSSKKGIGNENSETTDPGVHDALNRILANIIGVRKEEPGSGSDSGC